MSKAVKQWAKRARVRLLEELGPFCHWPGCRVDARGVRVSVLRAVARKLHFDHIHGKDYDATGLSTDQRILRYRKEAKEGKLTVLCEFHNQIKGDPKGNPWWKWLWMEDRYSASFAERVEA